MNIITTKCNGCVYLDKKICRLGKNIDEKTLLADGFCRFKRSSESYADFSIDQLRNEESSLSITIPCLKYDRDAILTTIDSIVSYNDPFLKEIAIELYDATKIESKNIIDYFLALNNKNIFWKVDSYTKTDDVEVTDWFLADQASFLINKSNWFLTLYPGDVVSYKSLTFIKDALKFKNINLVALFFDEKDSFRVVSNKYAYSELGGHVSMPWIEKIRKFDNGNKICIKID